MSKIELVEELHHEARRNFQRRKTNMRGINDTLQADLVEMIPYAKQNKNMKYILVVINIFSKKAYAQPLKNKTGPEVTKAMKLILESLNQPIRHIHVDKGNEFYNKSMLTMLKSFGINLYSTYTLKKAAIVERFNRTLKNKMWKQFSVNGSYKWINMLKSLIDNYNNTKHHTIKMKPNDVNLRNEKKLLNTVYKYKWNILSKNKPKFKVGDLVRMSKYKHIFKKGYTPNWTTEVFKIVKVYFTNPITYRLVDLNDQEIKGTIYEPELQLAKNPDLYLVEKILRTRGNKVYVKWLGFDSSHNSWVDKDDVI